MALWRTSLQIGPIILYFSTSSIVPLGPDTPIRVGKPSFWLGLPSSWALWWEIWDMLSYVIQAECSGSKLVEKWSAKVGDAGAFCDRPRLMPNPIANER